MEKQKLLFHQSRLASRGVYEMLLQFISAAKGSQSEMVKSTLELGISVLRGGNVDIQMVSVFQSFFPFGSFLNSYINTYTVHTHTIIFNF
jgi:hypothetical protein